jgi:hypothetical protein
MLTKPLGQGGYGTHMNRACGRSSMSATIADAYHFALPFRVPDDQPVHGDPGELTIAEPTVGRRLSLRLEHDDAPGQAKQLMLLGQGYDAEEPAREAGERARDALLLATLESHVGVEWGEDDERGLSVWRGLRIRAVARFRATATATTGVHAEILIARLRYWLTAEFELTSEQATCAELLAGFHFDMSERSRFLLAYAAIEQLCSQPVPRSQPYLAALAELMTHLDEIETDAETRHKLKGSLGHLTHEQETGRCRIMIQDKLGEAAVRRFNDLTKTRRQIAHKGAEIGGLSLELYQLARELLFATINRKEQE